MTIDLDIDWHRIKFDVRRSVRYHQRRRGFLDRVDQWGNFAGVIFGSSAIMALVGNSSNLAIFFAAVVTAWSALNLVFGTVQKARLHADLARRFVEVEKYFLHPQTPELLNKITEMRLTIEADEPPILRVLDCICHADQMRAEGYDRDQIPVISGFQRFMAQIWDVDLQRIESPAAAKTRIKEEQNSSATPAI